MERIFGVAAIIAAVAAAAILIPAELDATQDHAFCRLDYDSGVRSCAFETIDQCVSAIAGRGGICSRSPGSEVEAASADAQKVHARHRH